MLVSPSISSNSEMSGSGTVRSCETGPSRSSGDRSFSGSITGSSVIGLPPPSASGPAAVASTSPKLRGPASAAGPPSWATMTSPCSVRPSASTICGDRPSPRVAATKPWRMISPPLAKASTRSSPRISTCASPAGKPTRMRSPASTVTTMVSPGSGTPSGPVSSASPACVASTSKPASSWAIAASPVTTRPPAKTRSGGGSRPA